MAILPHSCCSYYTSFCFQFSQWHISCGLLLLSASSPSVYLFFFHIFTASLWILYTAFPARDVNNDERIGRTNWPVATLKLPLNVALCQKKNSRHQSRCYLYPRLLIIGSTVATPSVVSSTISDIQKRQVSTCHQLFVSYFLYSRLQVELGSIESSTMPL